MLLVVVSASVPLLLQTLSEVCVLMSSTSFTSSPGDTARAAFGLFLAEAVDGGIFTNAIPN